MILISLEVLTSSRFSQDLRYVDLVLPVAFTLFQFRKLVLLSNLRLCF